MALELEFLVKDGATVKIKELKKQLDSLSPVTKKADAGFMGINKSLLAIGGSALVASKALGGLKSITNSFIKLENAQIGVQKTTGLSVQEFNKLDKSLKTMSTTMAGLETESLYDIAEAAGQLGIQGTKNITEFTRVIAMVGLTTELSAKDSATAFAKLSNSLNEPIDKIETLASVANELSNTTSATVGDLLRFSQRLSGGAKTAGLMTAEIFGLSATMTDLAINFETGGTNINRVMLELISDSDKFANAMGINADKYANSVQDKPIAALQTLLKHLDNLNKTDSANFLEDIGFKGTEVKDVLLKLSSNTGLLTKNLKIANDEYKSGTSIMSEYEVASQGLEAQNKLLSNAIENASAKFGGELKPVILEVAGIITDFTVDLTENSDEILRNARTIGIVAGSIGTTVVAYKAYNKAVLLSAAYTATFGGALGGVNRAMIASAIASKGLAVAMKAIPFVAIAGTIALIADSLFDSAKASGELEKSLDGTGKKLSELTKAALEYRKVVLDEAYYDALVDKNEAIADAEVQRWHESDKEHKKDMVNKEEAIQKYQAIFKEYKSVNEALENYGKTIEKVNGMDGGADGGSGGSGGSKSLTKEELKALEKLKKAQEALWDSKYEILSEEMSFKEELYQEEFEKAKEYADAKLDLEVQNEQMKADLILAGFETIKSEQDIVNDKYLEMYDAVQGIFDETQMEKFFGSWNKELKNAEKSQKKYEGLGSKDWASNLKGSGKHVVNIGNAFADVAKEQKNWNKFSQENKVTEEDKNKHLSAQLSTYGNLAGAVGSMYEEGSSGAKAALVAQQALAVVEGGLAVVHAMTAGDPYTAIPRAIATAAIVAQAIGGSSGVGGAIAATPTTPRGEDYYDNARDLAEETNKPILDKFDRQIELLEEISGYGGTSLGFSLDKALAEYTAQTQLDIINASEMGAASGSQLVHASVVGATAQSGASNLVDLFSEEFQDNIFSWFATARPEASGVASNTHATALYGATIDATNTSVNEFIDILKYMESNNLLGTFGYTQIEYENILSDFQNATNEFVTSLLSDIGTLIDFSDDLKGAFDELTGTTKYEDIALSDAFADVNALIGDSSLADYMEEQIKNIDALEDSLSDADIALLLSSNVDDFKAQQDLIAQIQSDALITLDDGVIDALNYKDSILLVSDALAEANEDMLDFKENIASLIEDIDNTIASIRGNSLTEDELTDDEIRRLNLTQRALETSLANNDTDEAQELIAEITNLSKSISGSAFGDTSLLDKNLISNLEATKALISFEDEVINVNIVSSEIVSPVVSDTYSPSVTISNPANDSERLDNLEAIMTQVLITNKNVYDLLQRIENDGLKAL